MSEKSVNQKNAVETDILNTSPSSDETSKDTDQSSITPVWILLLAVFIVWKSSQTNLEYAIAYCVAYYIAGICAAGVVWLFSFRKKSSWTPTAWLNNGAYGMIAFLFLSFAVRTSVENTIEEAEQRESSISQQTTSNRTQNLPSPQSPHMYSGTVPQDDQLSETNVKFAPTNQQLSSIQRLLSDLGFRPGPIDGVVGPRTREAIRAFEHSHGWPETGEPSQRLLEFAESRSDRGSSSNRYNSPECILKRVMTDDDYRACGLNPPSTY